MGLRVATHLRTEAMDQRWSYVRIRGTRCMSNDGTDEVLCQLVGPAIDTLRSKGHCAHCFFLRYVDRAGPHLRFRADAPGIEASIARALGVRNGRDGVGIGVRLARYRPERAKYGGDAGVALAERAFCASSDFALRCVAATREWPGTRFVLAGQDMRWLLERIMPVFQMRERLLRSYSEYWAAHPAHRMTVDGNAPLIPKTDVAARREFGERTQDETIEKGLGLDTARKAWRHGMTSTLERLNSLERLGRLSVPSTLFCLNLLHTHHNRLGLSVTDEVLLSALLQSCP